MLMAWLSCHHRPTALQPILAKLRSEICGPTTQQDFSRIYQSPCQIYSSGIMGKGIMFAPETLQVGASELWNLG